MKNKFVRIDWFEDRRYRFIYFGDKFISIVMIKPILKVYLVHLRFVLEEGDKKHIVFHIKVDFHG